MANENQQVAPPKQRPLKLLIKDEDVQNRFKEMLGKNAPAFLMSVLNTVSNADGLAAAEPQSILMAAAVAATLNLPIDPNLGMAYIVPYKNNTTNITTAQLQIGYKGFISLALRTGQYKRLNVEPVYEGEIESIDRLSGDIKFNWIQDNDQRNKMKMIGVVAYFRLDNGFEKTLYQSDAELEAHGKKYSKTYKKGFGLWKDDPIGMKKKTVIKLLLEKYGPKSIELSKAIKTDQAVIGDYDGEKLKYPDNEPMDLEELNKNAERTRILNFIADANDLQTLEQVYEHIPDVEMGLIYAEKRDKLIEKSNKK